MNINVLFYKKKVCRAKKIAISVPILTPRFPNVLCFQHLVSLALLCENSAFVLPTFFMFIGWFFCFTEIAQALYIFSP